MSAPKVSVLMSVYNGERYLRGAIDSILAQTFGDFEFIIINDGSTDGTRSILESYRDERIRLFHQDNMGLTKSLNKGIRLARGEYIARMDADDISAPERLALEAAHLDSHPGCAGVSAYAHFIDHRGRILATHTPPTKPKDVADALSKGNVLNSEMLRKPALEAVGLYREEFRYAQDYDLCLRLAERYDLANLPEFLYSIRFHPRSITISRMAVQSFYADMARVLAAERRATGSDRLQRGEPLLTPDDRRRLEQLRRSRKARSKGMAALARKFELGGNRGLAIRFYLKAVALNPGDPKSRRKLATLLLGERCTRLISSGKRWILGPRLSH